MKRHCLVICMCLIAISSFAQRNITSSSLGAHSVQSDKPYALKIGQKIPKVSLHKIVNYKDSVAELSDFYKRKLLIIDFWATWCPPCIASLPVLDSIQKVMMDKVNIITVTYQTEDKVRSIFKNNENFSKYSLPFIVEDVTLSQYFPHNFVPHEVWIDSTGTVRAVTDSYSITTKNIDSILRNNKTTILTKKDSLTYDPKKYSDFQKKDILARSVLARTPLGIGVGWSDYKYVQKYNWYYKRIYWTHRAPLQLFYSAYTYGRGDINLKRIFFNIPDSSKYLIPTIEEFNSSDSLRALYTNYNEWLRDWEGDNDYCYELIMPDYVKDTLFFKYMLQDLNRGFDITASIEKKLMTCIVIRLADPKDNSLLKTNGMKPHLIWSANHDTLKGMQNEPLKVLVSELNSFKNNHPVVDLTNFTKPIDLKLNMNNFFQNDKFNIEELRKGLEQYGLRVTTEKRFFDALVISAR